MVAPSIGSQSAWLKPRLLTALSRERHAVLPVLASSILRRRKPCLASRTPDGVSPPPLRQLREAVHDVRQRHHRPGCPQKHAFHLADVTPQVQARPLFFIFRYRLPVAPQTGFRRPPLVQPAPSSREDAADIFCLSMLDIPPFEVPPAHAFIALASFLTLFSLRCLSFFS